MAVVYLESLDLQGFSTEIRIMNYKLENHPGKHPIATITAECKEQMDWNSFSKDLPTQEIRIIERHHNSILFSGLIEEVSLIGNGLDYYCYEIVLVGLSDYLDKKKKCRSFQNVSMTYQDIISYLANENRCSVKFQLTKDTAIHIPVIQYEETDWQFIKRMASNVQAEVLVNETARGLELIIKNEFTNVVDQYLKKRYTMGFSNKYYELQQGNPGLNRENFTYVQIESTNNYSMGDCIAVTGKTYIISEKQTYISGDIVTYNYLLAQREYLHNNTYYNPLFTGVSIRGKVVKTQNETVEIDLELRDEVKTDKHYAYQWVPESGNMMYCMPKVETTVTLYFSSSDEKSAMATRCIRLNGNQADVFDSDVKSFATEHDKMMCIAENVVHFITELEDCNVAQLSMLDDFGVFLYSLKKITIKSSIGVGFEADVIAISTVKQILMMQSATANGTEGAYLLQAVANHMGAKLIRFAFTTIDSYAMILDAPAEAEKKFEWGKWFGNLGLGLAVVLAITAAVAVTAVTLGAAGPVIVGAVVGAASAGVFSVAWMSGEDLISGNVRDTGEFLRDVAIDTFVGGVTGAIGGGIASFTPVKKFLVEQAASSAGTIFKNVLTGKDFYDGLLFNFGFSCGMKGLGKFGGMVSKKVKNTNAFKNVSQKITQSSQFKNISGKFKGIDNKLNKKKLAKRIDDTMELADFDKQQSKLINGKTDDLAKQSEKLKNQQAVMKELNNLKKAAISDGDKKGAGLFKNKLNNMKLNVAKTTNQINSINTSIAQRSQNIVNAKKLAEGVLDYSIDNKSVFRKAIYKALPGTVVYHIPKDVAKKATKKVEKDITKNATEYIPKGISGNSGNHKTIDVNAVADQVF